MTASFFSSLGYWEETEEEPIELVLVGIIFGLPSLLTKSSMISTLKLSSGEQRFFQPVSPLPDSTLDSSYLMFLKRLV